MLKCVSVCGWKAKVFGFYRNGRHEILLLLTIPRAKNTEKKSCFPDRRSLAHVFLFPKSAGKLCMTCMTERLMLLHAMLIKPSTGRNILTFFVHFIFIFILS